jgi:hypothetical protein
MRSENPLAWVSAVRSALRRAGADRTEIDRFSNEAWSAGDPGELASLCRRWVRLDGG